LQQQGANAPNKNARKSLADQGFDLDTGRHPRQVMHHDVQLPRDQMGRDARV
jgi:hypothetical protein